MEQHVCVTVGKALTGQFGVSYLLLASGNVSEVQI